MEESKKKVDILLNIPYSSREEFYELWVLFLRPIHKLSPLPCKVFAHLLAEREKYAKTNKDDAIIDSILFSEEVQNKLCAKLNIDRANMWNHLSILRKFGVLNKNRINIKYIPEIENEDLFRLMIRFYKK